MVTLNFKICSGIDKRSTGVAYRVGVTNIYVASQPGAQQGIQPAVHGDNVVALPRQTAQQLGTCHHGRAAHNQYFASHGSRLPLKRQHAIERKLLIAINKDLAVVAHLFTVRMSQGVIYAHTLKASAAGAL